MRISEMEVVPVAHREPPLRNSWGIHDELASRTVVRLTSADGTVGYGETYGDPDVIAGLERARDVVEGSNPYEYTRLRLRLQDDIVYGAIETALFDLLGKATGQPVHALLGGKIRDEVEFSAYLFFKAADADPESAAITPEEVASPEAMVDEARAFVDEHGFDVLKLKGGVLPPDDELRALELLADEFGAARPLRIDPNGAWSVETAGRIARRLREMDATVEFLEDPCPSMNAHARLKRTVDYPIATNMFVTAFDDLPPTLSPPAVDVVLSDHHYWGGLTGNRRLDHTVRTFDLGVGMHSNSHLGVSMAAMVHSAASMPTLRYACDTHYPWMAEDVIADPFTFEGGAVEVPTEPGLGVDVDEDELDRLAERYDETDAMGYSTVDSMAAAYAEAMAATRESGWLPNKPFW
jgi:glucarate dehydratase